MLGRTGPKTAWTDEQMTALIREDLASTVWVGEGHGKVWARLRRVLRLMREAGLLAPHRNKRVLGPYVHDGSIIPDKLIVMWAPTRPAP